MTTTEPRAGGRAAPPLTVGPVDTDRAFDHGAVSRFNAWFFTAFARYLDHAARHHKRAAFAGLRGGTVVEIGAGTGANLHHLPPGTRLYAIEPGLRMHDRLRRRSAAAGVEVTILATGAESIPLPDASVDEVIGSLVLCTVADPGRALAEIRRVLRPGGTFRFVEHVAAPPRRVRGLVQRAVRRPWGWLFEGCDPHRHTTHAVERAGFSAVRHERRKLRRSLFWPVNTAAWGIATR
ncbi:MAG TPA: class I SAM-dependent methyltransferase [Acidimicrobiales bacterium]